MSLRTIHMHLPGEPEFLLHKDEELFQDTKRALEEYDMSLMDIGLALVRPGLDISGMVAAIPDVLFPLSH